MQVDSNIIARLIKKAYLGGIVGEAIIDFGANVIQAVDPTNSIFIKVSEKSQEDTIGKIGIGDLSMVIKHLDAIKGETYIKKQAKRLVVGAKGRGEIKYLTVAEEFISSAVSEDNIDALIDPCVVKVNMNQQACSDFSSYMALAKTKFAKFSYDAKTKSVNVDSGLESEHQFTIPFGKAELIDDKAKIESFSVSVYGNHVDQIFGVLDWSIKEEPPMILMAPEHPLLIVQNEENIWACLPLAETNETSTEE